MYHTYNWPLHSTLHTSNHFIICTCPLHYLPYILQTLAPCSLYISDLRIQCIGLSFEPLPLSFFPFFWSHLAVKVHCTQNILKISFMLIFFSILKPFLLIILVPQWACKVLENVCHKDEREFSQLIFDNIFMKCNKSITYYVKHAWKAHTLSCYY